MEQSRPLIVKPHNGKRFKAPKWRIPDLELFLSVLSKNPKLLATIKSGISIPLTTN
jgi:hypothetical protein